MSKLHAMRLSEMSFEHIKNGTKTIEVRLQDEKRLSLLVGDRIEFSKRPNLNEKIRVVITDLQQFPSFLAMTKELDKYSYASGEKTAEEYIQYCYTIYTPDEEKKHGVVAIEFRLENRQ